MRCARRVARARRTGRCTRPPAADPRPGAERAPGSATASTPRTSTTSSWGAAPAVATTRWTSPGWPRSTPAGPSRRPASRSTGSAARVSRRSTSPRWASSPGFQDIVVGGGVESMSRPAPVHVDGFTANNTHLYDQYAMVAQGISADLIATIEGFTREECDRLAVDSQERAADGARRGPLRPLARPDPPRRRHASRSTTRSSRGPAPRSRASPSSRRASPRWAPTCSKDKGGLTRRPDGAPRLPASRPHRSRAPRRQLVGRRRRRVRRARRLAGLRPCPRHDAARPDHHDRGRRHRAGDHAHGARPGDEDVRARRPA